MWTYAPSPLCSSKEWLALDFPLAAAAWLNAVTDAQFAELQQHWSDTEITELLGVVAMTAFLSRWNDTMATPLVVTPEAVAQPALGKRSWAAGKHHAA